MFVILILIAWCDMVLFRWCDVFQSFGAFLGKENLTKLILKCLVKIFSVENNRAKKEYTIYLKLVANCNQI